MSEPAAKRSFGTRTLVDGMALVAGRASGVGVADVITHLDDQSAAGPDGLYGVTLTNNPASGSACGRD